MDIVRKSAVVMMALPLALGACATMPAQDAAPAASGTLMLASGQPVGTVAIMPTAGGMRLMVTAGPLAPGTYGIHIHTTGRCDGPDFMTAGAHWNPTARQHGLQNPAGHHRGDLPNLAVGSDGTGTISADTEGMLMGAGGLLDDDGAALVLHAQADDNVSDPSGNSGARIACAVLAAG